jgi:ATP-dependent DNA helicase RecQ
MGIDKPNVRLVLHYIHSGSLEDYYQEAGRAGRDGNPSNCLLLFNVRDRQIHDRMRDHGHVAGELLRRVWLYLAAMSGGRRPVPLDECLWSTRLGKGAPAENVARALSFLEERGLLGAITRPDQARLRLLASPLRVECERGSLSANAAAVLASAVNSQQEENDWIALSMTRIGLPPQRFAAALDELESRQLVFVDRVPARAVVNGSSVYRQMLERAILQARTRREAERVKLGAMVGYATTLMCRRKYFLNYFGDPSTEARECTGCDICKPM